MAIYSLNPLPNIDEVKEFREKHGVGINESRKVLLGRNLLEALPEASLEDTRRILIAVVNEVFPDSHEFVRPSSIEDQYRT